VAFVVSGLAVAAPALRPAGYNVLLVLAFFFVLQGLAVVAFYANRLAGPPVLRAAVLVLVLVNPWAPQILALLGLFDIWFDFRKWAEPPEPERAEQDEVGSIERVAESTAQIEPRSAVEPRSRCCLATAVPSPSGGGIGWGVAKTRSRSRHDNSLPRRREGGVGVEKGVTRGADAEGRRREARAPGRRDQGRGGYGRNYLLPRGLAVLVTEANKALIARERKKHEAQISKEKAESEALAERIGSLRFIAPRKVGEHDVLYGSVTSGDVAEFLKGKGIEIDKRKVLLDEPVKKLGEHDVRIKLHPEVTATLKLLVSKEG
jgi:large subunit ribosomal protein L9